MYNTVIVTVVRSVLLMSIRWDDLGHEKYEDMVSVLVSRLHPDAQRIDGKGGDGGRDVQIVDRQDGSMLETFELKSFTGRMNPVRGQQVTSSLKRAANLNPEKWTLIVPIDPTPKEDEWFRKLGNNCPFPIRWFGKTWLDEKMAAFPDIRRYFLEGAKDEVYRLLRELKEEQARITNVRDAVGRVRTLHERLNEIDPYYRYELSTGPNAADGRPMDVVFSAIFDKTRVDVYPKYEGAVRDRPITISVNFKIGPDFKEVRAALDYGLDISVPSKMINDITIDAPLGLGGSFLGGELHLFSNDTRLAEPVTIALNVMADDGLVASYPIRLSKQTSGARGAIVSGSDNIGWLQTTLKIDEVAKWFEVKFWLTPSPAIPAALLPLLQWIAAVNPPHILEIHWPNGVIMCKEINTSFCLDTRFVTVVKSLAYLQDQSGIHWEIQTSSMIEEAQDIVNTATLVKGESINFTWKSFNLDLDHWGPELEELGKGGQLSFLIEQDMEFELESVRIPIGLVRTHIESARIADPVAIRRAIASGSIRQVKLVPGESNKAKQMVVPKAQ